MEEFQYEATLAGLDDETFETLRDGKKLSAWETDVIEECGNINELNSIDESGSLGITNDPMTIPPRKTLEEDYPRLNAMFWEAVDKDSNEKACTDCTHTLENVGLGGVNWTNRDTREQTFIDHCNGTDINAKSIPVDFRTNYYKRKLFQWLLKFYVQAMGRLSSFNPLFIDNFKGPFEQFFKPQLINLIRKERMVGRHHRKLIRKATKHFKRSACAAKNQLTKKMFNEYVEILVIETKDQTSD